LSAAQDEAFTVRLMGRAESYLRDFAFRIEILDATLNEKEEAAGLPPLLKFAS
jgi:hypothetical protein